MVWRRKFKPGLKSCGAVRHFSRKAQRLSRTGSFSWRVATDEITWSEQLYRIFEFDQAVPVTLELIGTRVHPDDLPLFHDMIDRARGDGSDFEYEHRLQMPDRLGQVPAPGRARDPRPGWSAGVHRRGSGRDGAPTLGGGTRQGPIGARTRGQGHEPRRIDGVDRARSQPAAVGHHHQRQHLSADAGRRSSQRRRARAKPRGARFAMATVRLM